MRSIPGPQSSRLIQTLNWRYRPTELLTDCAARYGEIFRLRTYMDGDLVMVVHPDAIQQIFACGYEQVHQPKDEQFAALLLLQVGQDLLGFAETVIDRLLLGSRNGSKYLMNQAPDATTAAYAGTVRNSSNVGSVESFSKRARASVNLPLVKRASPTSARMRASSSSRMLARRAFVTRLPSSSLAS